MLGIMMLKLFILRNNVLIVEEDSVVFQEAGSITLKQVEEDSRDSIVNAAPGPPKSVEIIPANADSMSYELNAITRGCCAKVPAIPESCYGYCSFDKLNSQTIVDLALYTSPCRMDVSGIWQMMLCMSSSHDHTDCCREKRVDQTNAGDICLHFCNGRLEPEPMTNMGYFPCLEVWEPITRCFKEYIIEETLVKIEQEAQNFDSNNALL
uniref:Domain of unknown function DB domain-containing protein n=1 Tax=Plectus sambesii TaxID=2011161 RepID=A0A914WUI7_9BILA